jgi:hypothetical protein
MNNSNAKSHQSVGAAADGDMIRQPLLDRSNDKGLRPQLNLGKDGSAFYSTNNWHQARVWFD